MGMDMDSWVVENEARLVFSSPRPGHDSLDFAPKSFPRKDSGCLSIFESELTVL
jgi:hypothetical protein